MIDGTMSEESQNEASKNPPTLAVEAAAAEADISTNVSQTNSGQVTSSSEAPEAAKWSCEVCTYENFPLSRKCTMCRSPKPCLNENIFNLQDGASALPAPDVCGAESVAERLRPLRISSPQAAPTHTPGKWPCSTCTYENWPKSTKCAMCGAANAANVGASAANTAPANTANSCPAGPKLNIGINDICGSGMPHEDRRRPKRRNIDWLWLQACLGVVEGSARCVEAYLAAGGSVARALSAHEVALLQRHPAFGAGHTLVHLAIRFQRQDILSTLLSRISGGEPALKRSPSYIAPDLAAAIRRHMASCMRPKKGSFPSPYLAEFATFSLPAEIEELPVDIQEQLFSELLDRDAQRTLEAHPPLINWSREFTVTLGSRLVALWNRSAGDCLPDAVCQAAYGVADRRGALRSAAHAALVGGDEWAGVDGVGAVGAGGWAGGFAQRWAGWERAQAAGLQYALEEDQLRREWATLVAATASPRAALHQLHVFVLAHVMRRPLLVYGVDVVNSFRGEPLGYAKFQGIYLPLLWEPEQCSKSPLCLGYTRGHFSALVPLDSRHHYICRESQEESEEITFLPLTDCDGKLLPVHFLTCEEMADEEGIVRRWVSAAVTRGGGLAATQRRTSPLLQAQLLQEWLNHYRRLAEQSRGPFPPRLAAADPPSDPDSDRD